MMTFDYYKRKHWNTLMMTTYVLVCSDDPEWCAEQEFFDDERFLINTDVPEYDHLCLEGDGSRRRSKVPYTDLCLMSLCNGASFPRPLWGGGSLVTEWSDQPRHRP